MRRILTQTLLSILFVVAAAEVARAQSTQQKTDPPPPAPKVVLGNPAGSGTVDLGRIVDGTYSNDFFGFSFTVPKDWTVLGAADNKKILDKGKEIVEEGTSERKKEGLDASLTRTNFLFTASKYPQGTTGPGFNALMMCIAERVPTAVVKNGADYITLMQRAFEGTAAKLELTGPMRTVNVGGVPFTVADVKLTAGPVVTVQKYYVRITKGYALAWAYTYFDESDLKTLDEMIASVKFK